MLKLVEKFRRNFFSFTTFYKKEGLLDNEIWSIEIDRNGNIWVGSLEGVSIFDGETFTSFPIPKADITNPQPMLSHNRIGGILEDRKGNIWFGTNPVGVCRYNGKTFEWDKDFSFSLQTIGTGNFNYTNVVYAGYGIVDAANGINDYENLDVQGKLVIVSEGSAAGIPTMGQGGNRAFNANPASPMSKMRNAMAKGAAGLCIINADFPKKTATPTKGNMYVKANTAKGFAMLSISKTLANEILGTSNYTKGSFATQVN